MEQTGLLFKEKVAYKYWCFIVVIGLFTLFFAIGWLLLIQNYGLYSLESILPNGAFLVIFITLAVLFWKLFRKVAEVDEKKNEFNRKINWEEFQHALYKEERMEKLKYDTIKGLIEKLEDKDTKKEHPLKEEVEKLRADMEEWKKQIDKQYIIEISKVSKSK